jgi:cell filamentation protein
MAKRKALNFDLDNDVLTALFGENNRSKGYRAIRRFLEANGFEHRQLSGYFSVSGITVRQTTNVVGELYEKLPWLRDAVKKFDVTEVGTTYDLAETFKSKEPTSVRNEPTVPVEPRRKSGR